jgi:hypothetical protein
MVKLKLLWLVCSIALTPYLFGQFTPQQIHSVVDKNEFQIKTKAVSAVARQAIQRGEKPGAFTGVQEKFTNQVVILTNEQRNGIANTMVTDGLISKTNIPNFIPDPNKIYVDSESDLVMQFQPISDDNMLVFRPQLHHVFEDFTIPDQEVALSAANTSSTIENSQVATSGKGEDYNMVMRFDSVTYKFKEDGIDLSATLVGDIKFRNPRIEGSFSKNNGYKLVFKAGEAINLKVYSDIKLQKEIIEPIWGFEIEAGNYGKCELGVFLVIEIDGKVNLVVTVDQGFELAAGVKGGTFYYVPTSLNHILDVNNWCDVNYRLTGEIKAFAGVQCQTVLKIKGYKALDIKARAGLEAKVETANGILSGDIGMRMKIWGKAVVKNFTLLDKYYSFLKKSEMDYGNFDMEILEACAFRDYAVGRIVKSDSKQPYVGALTLFKVSGGSRETAYQSQTNADGYFAIKNVSMVKGDKLAVQVPGSPNRSPFSEPTIPFSEIKLMFADYYTGEISGVVAAGVGKYEDLLKGSSSASSNAPMAAAISKPGNMAKLENNITRSKAVERIEKMKSSMVTYKGPIQIIQEGISQPAPLLQSSGPNSAISGIGGHAPSHIRKPTNVATGKVKNIGSVDAPVFSPFGIFTITRNDLKPSERIKARIIVDGFEVESDWLETDGLMVLPIETGLISRSVNQGSVTLTGDNMVVMVAALRSEEAPQGKVRMAKGLDMLHASIQQPYAVVDKMPQLQKPFVWYDKSLPLQPEGSTPGLSVASSGNWTSTLRYASMADALNPDKNLGHGFELISYVFKGTETGFSVLEEKCPVCSSTKSFIESMGKSALGNQLRIDPGKIQVPQKVNKQLQQKGVGNRF